MLPVLIGLLLVCSANGALAWITTNTDETQNLFEPGSVTCEVVESGWTEGNTAKSSICVNNTGNTDAYIRVAIVGNWCDASGNIVAPWTDTVSAASGWTKSGGFYYYESAVSPNSSTGELLGSEISGSPVPTGLPEGSHLVVDVLAQAIQSEPASVVANAWGWTPPSQTPNT